MRIPALISLLLVGCAYAQTPPCQTNYTLPTGSYSVALTTSSTYIKTSVATPTLATTVSASASVKLDCTKASGYIELNPGFSAAPTGNGVFIAQPLDGCGGLEPFRTLPDAKDQEAIGEASAKGITLYPNPTRDVFTLKASNLDHATVTVYSPLGTLILSQKLTVKGETEINLGNAAAGVYLVKVAAGGYTAYKKVIKQ